MAQKVAKLGIERDLNFILHQERRRLAVPRGRPMPKEEAAGRQGRIAMDAMFITSSTRTGTSHESGARRDEAQEEDRGEEDTTRTRTAAKTAKRKRK
jgi:hypothetical protein